MATLSANEETTAVTTAPKTRKPRKSLAERKAARAVSAQKRAAKLSTSAVQPSELPAGVSVAPQGVDTSQRAYSGFSPFQGFKNPQPGLHYLRVNKLPDDYDLDMYQWAEDNNYTVVEEIGNRGAARWYSIPQEVIDQRDAAEREERALQKMRAKQMPKTGGLQVEITQDNYAKLPNRMAQQPIVFNH